MSEPPKSWPAPDADAKALEGLFKTCFREIKDERGAAFIESLYKFWKDRGFLSPKQRAALKAFHDNL